MSDLLTTVPAARAFCEAARARGAAVGLVPTMGALHDGHRSLLRQSLAQNDVTVVSIFVNPLQFGAGEDLEAYPRGFENDLRICAGEGAAAVFAPSEAEMYPQPPVTSLDFGGLSASLEGACRPGHLAGVGLVVAKLFAIVGACRAYFGEKDWQQLAVVRRLADDLSLPVDVVGCPTVRQPDGVALSSRNAYLGADERAAAGVLHRCLLAGAALIEAGERASAVVEAAMASVLAAEPLLGRVDYARVVDAATLARREPLRGELRLMVAAHLGGTRLIDNLGATVPPP
ncbi:MAG: pantoate--beta-alanine ligase [Acidimicrobiia bacterium]|nr:pantoate--beta-alanine ligase [Acidimicrobiia bacterium]